MRDDAHRRLQALAADCIIAGLTLDQATTLFQEAMIREAYLRTGNKRIHAAAMLGMHRNTMLRRAIKSGMPVHKRTKVRHVPA